MHARASYAVFAGIVLLGAATRAKERGDETELQREMRREMERELAQYVERVHTGPIFRLATGGGYFGAGYEGALAPCVLCAERRPVSSRISGPAFAFEALAGWGYHGWMFGARFRLLLPFEWNMVVAADDEPIDANPFPIVMPGLFLDWYPDPDAGFHVTLAPSFATASVTDAEKRLEDSGVLFGPALAVGVGYQFWLPAAASMGVLSGVDMGWLSYEDPGGIEPDKQLAFVSATLAIEITFNGEEKTHERR